MDGRDKGYNLTRGGEGYLVNDYYHIYELWESGLNQKTIAQILKTDEATIIRALNSFNISSHIRRSRAAKKGASNRRIPVIQYDKNMNFIASYDSIQEAALINNIDNGDIGKVCKGRRKTAGGYIWRYKKEEI